MEKSSERPEGEWWWLEELEEKPQPPRPWKTDSLEKFRLLKQWVRDCDPVGGWPLESRLERVRKNVMQAITEDAEKVQPPPAKPWAKAFKV